MVNVHLVQDEKFINSSIDVFESYYPNQNFFIVNTSLHHRKFVQPRENVFFIPFEASNWMTLVKEILPTQSANIIVHYLTKYSAIRGMELKNLSLQNRLYWIFYGADLYYYLEIRNKYQLFDYKKNSIKETLLNKARILFNRYKHIKDFCIQLDYFCFWNPYDYQLLCKYLKTNAKFKRFSYITASQPDTTLLTKSYPYEKVLVNHSGSWTGNHITVLQKLKDIQCSATLVLPLSYGPEEHIKMVKNKAIDLFPNQCEIINDFLPIDSYYQLINECQYAVMGHRRQEAAGNISYLLMYGKKVFLREANPLYNYFKDSGFYIYSFENDLCSEDAFKPLTYEQKLHNCSIFQKSLLKENIDDMMLSLFK